MKKHGVYAGTFDPVTKGHLDIIFQAAALMDKLYVVVSVNTAKNPLFSDDERATMVQQDIETVVKPKLAALGLPCNIEVKKNAGLTAAFMKAHNAPYYVRGLRIGSEFDQEYPAVIGGKGEYKDFTPVFLCVTDPALHVVSSTLAREIARFRGDSLENYVTPEVAQKLKERMAARPSSSKP